MNCIIFNFYNELQPLIGIVFLAFLKKLLTGNYITCILKFEICTSISHLKFSAQYEVFFSSFDFLFPISVDKSDNGVSRPC